VTTTLRGKAHRRCFSAGPKTFTDPSLRRLTFGGNITETGTGSCRLARTRAGQQARRRKACVTPPETPDHSHKDLHRAPGLPG
jgi:hypothetical protein